MCMYPQSVASWDYNRHAKKSSKKGNWTGAVKNWNKLEPKPCGKCPECRRNRALAWCFRLNEEQKVAKSSYFITLTYDDEHIQYKSGDATLVKDDLKRFTHTIRRRCEYIHQAKKQPDFKTYGKRENLAREAYQAHKGVKPKYYAIGEYGTKLNRPHYHLILFNVPRPIIKKLDEIWKKGFVKVGTVTPKSIRYVSNYIMHLNANPDEKQQEFAVISNYMGASYLNKNTSVKRKQIDATVEYNGHKIPMPAYYREKIYIPEERQIQAERNQNVWQQNLDKKVQELKKKGITLEEYNKEQNAEKWRKYFNNRKYKR